MEKEKGNLREVFETFYHPRVEKSDKDRAGKKIKGFLERSGYSVTVTEGFYANIRTECEEPKIIVCAHYDGPFVFIKDIYPEWEEKLGFILSKDTLAALVLLLGIVLVNYGDKKFELPLIAVIMLYLFVVMTGPYFIKTQISSADDNTSGLAAALILAQSLKKYRSQVQFIFFDKEEWGMLGSKDYVKKNTANLAEGTGILNLDCIGRGQQITLSSHERNQRENMFKKDFARFLEQNQISFTTLDQSKCDCKSFRKKGYEAFTVQRKDIIRGKPRLQWIHTSEDTMESIDFQKIEQVIMLVDRYIKAYFI